MESMIIALMLAATPAAVTVNFIDAERYTDATPSSAYGSARERDATLAALRQHLTALGARYLQPGDRLSIDVLDVDLAGRFEPWRPRAYDVRFLRDITWPHIKLRTVLERDQRSVTREEQVADLDYLLNATACRGRDSLCYEKRMLDAWFARRFTRDE